jgi:hypothetical protein
MKTIAYTFFVSLFCLFAFSLKAQQILNGGFEETYIDTVYTPNVLEAMHWKYGSSNSLDCGVPLGSLTSESNNGDWALKLETILCGGHVYPGIITTSFNFQSFIYPEIVAHFLNDRPDQISFYHKFSPINNDTAFVRVLLFNYPEVVPLPNYFPWIHVDTVAYTEFHITESADIYTQLTVNFEYENADIPAYIRVIFSSFKNIGVTPIQYGNIGTTLWIDDVELVYLPTSIHNLISSGDVTLFPNPVAEHFSIDLPGNTTINSVSILDFSGRVVNIPASKNGMYSLNGLSTGMYFVQIETDKGSVVKKVVKE